MQMPQYAQVDEVLFSGGSSVGAAECHGVLWNSVRLGIVRYATLGSSSV